MGGTRHDGAVRCCDLEVDPVGTRDNSIPANLLAFMAERAGSKKTVTIEGASQAVMISHPDAVVELIELAAAVV